MSDKSKLTGPTGKIEFIENHRPALPSGDYEITVSQSIVATKPPPPAPTGQDSTAPEERVLVKERFESQPRRFSVLGPRFTLEPQVVRAVFPPAGSLGEHSSVLPHISFQRSTLPWERFIIPLNDALETHPQDRSEVQKQLALKTPWLALLLFDQDELVEKKAVGVAQPGANGRKSELVEAELTAGKVSGPKTCHLETDPTGKFWELKPKDDASTPAGLLSPTFTHESGQQAGDPVTVIDVSRELLEAILPSMADVQLLGHVRQPTDDLGRPAGDQVATILANRLPKRGQVSVVHLVSLEGRYGSDQNDLWNLPADGKFVRLVSLKSWRFTCLDKKHSFKGLLHHLNKEHLFLLDQELVKSLPGSMRESKLDAKIREAFIKHMSLAEGAVSKQTTARLEREAWIIEDKEKHQRYLIRREKAEEYLGVYENETLLFELNIGFRSKLPGGEEEQAITKEIRNKFSSHKPLSDEAKIRKERIEQQQTAEAWRINDPPGATYTIRREETDYLGVYDNQKLLFKFDFPGGEKAQTVEEAIEEEIPSRFSKLEPPVELSPGAEISKEPAEAWRVTDPNGSNYMIRKNGDRYEVHGSMPHTLRLPTNHLKQAKKFVVEGNVPLPHEMRQGNRSVSWYRGPLAPGRVDRADEDEKESSEGSLRARSADQLVRYNPTNGMFDVTYAAAWELGRLLTLQNEKVAVSLLDWKRRHRHSQERLAAMRALEHLPVAGRPASPDLPADVTKWFADLALLVGVPFNYLVPDERMLPQESIRFFWVDPEWIRCLHDGAFSIGRVLPSDYARDAAHHPDRLPKPHAMVTGFLLRSEVVSGWPDLQVDGYDEAVPHENYEHDTMAPPSPIKERIPFDRWLQEAMDNGDASALVSPFGFSAEAVIEVSPIVADSSWLVNVNENETLYRVDRTGDGFRLSIENKLPMLRMERLSPNVLLCMFAGDIKTVDIHQKPEAMHFGLDPSDDGTEAYSKELKSHIGGELPGCEVEFLPRKKDRVIDIKSFNERIQKKLLELTDDYLKTVAKDSVGEAGVEAFVAKFRKAANNATSAQFALQMTEGVQKVRFVAVEPGIIHRNIG